MINISQLQRESMTDDNLVSILHDTEVGRSWRYVFWWPDVFHILSEAHDRLKSGMAYICEYVSGKFVVDSEVKTFRLETDFNLRL